MQLPSVLQFTVINCAQDQMTLLYYVEKNVTCSGNATEYFIINQNATYVDVSADGYQSKRVNTTTPTTFQTQLSASMRRSTKQLTILDINNQSLAAYTNLGFIIDEETYNISNNTIVFNPLYDPFALYVTYYDRYIYKTLSQTNTTINVPSVVRFSFTKCLTEVLTITLGNDSNTQNCSENTEMIMLAPAADSVATIQSDKRDNITINITPVNSFENHQSINLEFKPTNVTVILNTTLLASDFTVYLNTYRMNNTN